ncbi:MAG: type II toxin-antitoxin system Phd/YefM family antitoxin [Myxococcota bacterium]
MQVNIHQAKTQLSQLLARVEAGEEVVIARAGEPVAKLVKLDSTLKRRVPGRYRGQGYIAPDFDEPMRDFEDAFYGS